MYETLTTLAEIQAVMSKAGSDDGESSEFELKGSYEKDKLTKDDKKLLAKEICAFANTYGGVVCYHFGGDSALKPFPSGIQDALFNSLESWLRDSLEPKLLGMDLKNVDGVYLIHVPESKIKPHRTQGTTEYYYRHSTISQKMPEIMVSSMYRSQGFLEYRIVLSLNKQGNTQLAFLLGLVNNTNVSGSKPKIVLQFCSPQLSLKFMRSPHMDGSVNSALTLPKTGTDEHLPMSAVVETNSAFSELILYPQDTLMFQNFSEWEDRVKLVKCVLVKAHCMIRESPSQSETYLFTFEGEEKKGHIEMSTLEHSEEDVVKKFQTLIAD